ncbi:MAG: SDR family oxidoreductase [Spirochaetaceae bacterium]|nr:MAG: SDR family oxidoreductase [Spirochaetaceae bacterium]
MHGRVALITGAGGGIGAAIADAFAARGAALMLTGRTPERLDRVAQRLRQRHSVRIDTVCADLAEVDASRAIVEAVRAMHGRLDVLVNNAGVAIARPILQTGVDEWDLHMAVNARAPMLLCVQAHELLRKSEDAVVVNIGSVVGHKGYAEQGAYSASKHALLGLTKVLAKELQTDGIRVHMVSPGGVATPMISRMRPDLDQQQLMRAEDVARAVVFLVESSGNAVCDEIMLRRRASQPWQ